MTSLLVLCCFSLLLAGVFGADFTVSLMKGDDVTLPINAGKIRGNETLQWKFNGNDIATIDLEVKTSQLNCTDKRFRNRLNLDRTTGSLTISKIKTEETGEYQLKIKGIKDINYKTLKTFSVTVTDEVKSESGTEEKSITLNIDNETQSDDVIEWKFENTLIAKVDRRISPHPDFPDERFRDRLDVNSHGYLIIKELFKIDYGVYEVNITNSKRIIHKRFSLTVTDGVFEADDVIKKGDSVTLPIHAGKIRGDERLQWKFKDKIIANIDIEVKTSQLNYLDERFRNRLNLDRTTGSLTIKNIKPEETGEYQLEIKGIRDKDYKTLKTFSVNVNGKNPLINGQSVWIGIGIGIVIGIGIGIGTGILLYHKWKGKKCTSTSNNGKETHSPVLLGQNRDVTQDTEISPREISKNEEEEE